MFFIINLHQKNFFIIYPVSIFFYYWSLQPGQVQHTKIPQTLKTQVFFFITIINLFFFFLIFLFLNLVHSIFSIVKILLVKSAFLLFLLNQLFFFSFILFTLFYCLISSVIIFIYSSMSHNQ
jgi:hypothetical protein